MWDSKISNTYDVKKTPHDYAYKFIPIMKKKANEAIRSYTREKYCNRDEAIEAIEEMSGKTIAKLLDEYNYMQFTSARAS